MRQLHLEVSSFLSDTFHTFENRLLPNDVILLRNNGEALEEPRGRGGGEQDAVQHDFESVLISRTSLS
jgi:hypothetical protein